jgi:hypothetical protein
LPFKVRADRRHHIPKQRHRVTNWAEYDAALRARGSLTVWDQRELGVRVAADTVGELGDPGLFRAGGGGFGQRRPFWDRPRGSIPPTREFANSIKIG